MKQVAKEKILAEVKKGYWFTKKEIAEKLGVDIRAVGKAIKEGVEEKEIRIVGLNKNHILAEEYKIETLIFFKEMTSIEDEPGSVTVKGTSEELIYVKNAFGKPELAKKIVPMKITISKLALEEIATALKSEVPFY